MQIYSVRRVCRLLIGLGKLIIEKIWNGKSLKLDGIKYYLGRGAYIETKKGGYVYLGKKTWINDYCSLIATEGKIELGYNNFFNTNVKINALWEIRIGDNNLIGPNVVIVDHNHCFEDKTKSIGCQGFEKKPITIGSNVWIGANSTICAGVDICDRVIIGANSVVTKSITSSGIYCGVPAKKIKEI